MVITKRGGRTELISTDRLGNIQNAVNDDEAVSKRQAALKEGNNDFTGTNTHTGSETFSGLNTDTISEKTTATGVTVDGVLLKDGQVAATALGNAVNTGQVLTTEVAITKANILAMNATPVELVAAPGAGYVLELISAMLIYHRDTATYGGGGDVTINYSGGAAITTTIVAANSFGAAGDKIFSFNKLNAAGGYTMPVNTAIVITNATAAFTDPGNAAGVGRLHISYRIHTTNL